MKRDIDEGQDLSLCRVVTSETPVGTPVLFVMKGSPSHGDHGVLLKTGIARSAVAWAGEDPDAQHHWKD